MLSKRTLLICAGIAVAICAVVVWFVVMPSEEEVSEVVVNQNIEDLKNHVSTLSLEIEALIEQAERKVVIVREDVRTEVATLGPDDVCDALNSELSRYRMDSRSGRMDDTD